MRAIEVNRPYLRMRSAIEVNGRYLRKSEKIRLSTMLMMMQLRIGK
jgi:hypothetical protein